MAIDRMKRIAIVAPGVCAHRLVSRLHDLGAVEVTSAAEEHGDRDGALRVHEAAIAECDEHLLKVNTALHLLDRFAPVQKSFFAGLTPLPELLEVNELHRAMNEIELDALYRKAQELDEAHRLAERTAGETRSQLDALKPFAAFEYRLDEAAGLERARVSLAWLNAKARTALEAHEGLRAASGFEAIAPGEPALYAFAHLPGDAEAVRKGIGEIGGDPAEWPAVKGRAQDAIRALEEDLVAAQEKERAVAAEAAGMAPLRRPLLHLKALWESNKRKEQALGRSLAGKWTVMLSGYVRAADADRLAAMLHDHFPEASLSAADPAPDENVPVAISLPPLLKPIQLLINMFGLPPYASFDPSPFLMLNFFVFFGICFSDVGYGLMMLAMSLYLMSKTRAYPGVYNFAKVFLYASFTTIFFGALMGAWFGDLYKAEFLGEGNVFLLLQQRFVMLDPMAQPVVGLMIALAIGVLNQFYGIALKMYGALLQRDYVTAVCDGLLWLITLPGMLILISVVFVPVPPAVLTLGMALMGGGAIGLVLTQGRGEASMAGKIMTGVVSIYGIVGSYGCTAFIGDMLSYCRLLALGLTTGIVASSINLMAGMLREAPYVGGVLFVGLLVFGHLFNFLISVLGAFVHSVRLIFVEFFGRFYSSGARPFAPLQFDSRNFIMKAPAQGPQA